MLNFRHSIDIEELRNLYLEKGLTCRQISLIVGVPHRSIHRYLKAAGVQLRNPGYPVNTILADRDWLKRQYLGEQKSSTAIATEIGCSHRSVSHWLARHGIEARPTGAEKGHKRNDSDEVRHKMALAKRDRFIGSDNPNWRGGITLKDPERNRYRAKMWVKAVKDRDGWKCTKCNSTDNLHAHHIKRWCDYPDLRYDVSNGATLCHPCHEAAHGSGYKFRWPEARKRPTSAPVS
ncbi:MAG TPA: HNH endonuclease [Anaerolineales bacterium]